VGRIGCLALWLLWAAAPARADVFSEAGLRGPPVLLVEEAPGHTRRSPLALRPCPEGQCVEVTSEPLKARIQFERSDIGFVLDATVEWKKPHWVHRVALELPLGPGAIKVVGRDLEEHAVKRANLGRFDPKWVTIGATTLISDDDVDELAIESRLGGTVVTVELDSAAARPFTHDARCAKKWQDPNRHIPVPLRLRVPGEKVTARVQLARKILLPVAKSAWPDGRRAALVFTDHADQTTLRTLTVLAKGFAEHHLVLTKALFSHGTDRPQLDDPRMVALADDMSKSGSEIVPHSATPRPDDRSVTSQALERFGRWTARTWIDHQPETNCEAFGDLGYQSGGKFGIADLLVAHKYEYVWAEVDASPGDLNLFLPAHLEQRAPTLWPLGRVTLGGPSTLWMFRTMWAFLEAKRFYGMYNPMALDKLEKERGLHVAHTYLDTYHPKRTKFGMRNVIVPADKKGLPGGPGDVKLDARMDQLLLQLEERQKRGTLWVPTVAQLADRMRQIAAVTLTVRKEGSLVVHSPETVKGVTFVLPRPAASVLVDGKPVKLDGNAFVVDLPAGDTSVELQAP
jgi:hypothetical protein